MPSAMETNHVHISAVSAITIVLVLIVFSYIWRGVAGRLADRPLGQAMAAIL